MTVFEDDEPTELIDAFAPGAFFADNYRIEALLGGGASARVYAAYAETHPLAAGYEERVALWQLYPLLVHVNLFAGSYVASLERTLRALV